MIKQELLRGKVVYVVYMDNLQIICISMIEACIALIKLG